MDVLALAECTIADHDLLDALNTGRSGGTFTIPWSNSKYVKVVTRYSPSAVRAIADEQRWTIRELTPPVGCSVILVAAHLPSKLYKSAEEQTLHTTLVSESISRVEKTLGHQRTIVIGDLNMDPFDSGMVAAQALNAVMDSRIAKLGSRKVDGRYHSFFYNPMWNFLGDVSEGPPGTYFDNQSRNIKYFWHTFDQILVRPDLLTTMKGDNFRIVSECAGTPFVDRSGKWSCPSDHLPILARLEY